MSPSKQSCFWSLGELEIMWWWGVMDVIMVKQPQLQVRGMSWTLQVDGGLSEVSLKVTEGIANHSATFLNSPELVNLIGTILHLL